MVRNLVLGQRDSGAIKRDFRPSTSPNENFEYGYPHSNTILSQIGALQAALSSLSSNEM